MQQAAHLHCIHTTHQKSFWREEKGVGMVTKSLKYSAAGVRSAMYSLEVKAFIEQSWNEAVAGVHVEEDVPGETIYQQDAYGAFSNEEEMRDAVKSLEVSFFSQDGLLTSNYEMCSLGERILKDSTLVFASASTTSKEAFAQTYREKQISPIVEETREGDFRYWMLISKA